MSFLLKESLGDVFIPLMVRPAHHERNKHITVRLESFDYAHKSLAKGRNKNFMTLGFLLLITAFVNVWAEEPKTNQIDIMSGHGHHGMDHSKTMPHDSSANDQTAEQVNPILKLDQGIQSLKDNRDPRAYTDGNDYSDLSKPIMGDSHYLGAFIADRLEGVNVRDDFSMIYDWQAWYGQDYDKLVIRAEGEIDQGTFKNNRNEALWARALTAFWDTQLGIRVDSGLGTDRVWGAFGVQGFAPYWVYIEATAYVGEEGRTAFRLETEYDALITQKLILQPRVEVNFYSQSDPSRLVSSGLSNIEAGLRLRYEIKREFAPYVGIEWASTFGSAADIIQSQGKQAEETRFVVGVHFWF